MDLTKYKILNAVPTIYYVPNFITPEEEAHILKNVYSVPKPKWTCLLNRRLQDYGGVPHEKGMIPERIPEWLQRYLQKISQLNVFNGKPPNQVLVNEYLAGQGIMSHTDGPLFYPTVTTISCGSHTVLEFVENNESRRKVCEVLLENGSLVIFQDDLYTKYLHSIKDIESDVVKEDYVNLEMCGEDYHIGDVLQRDTRVSLTIRNVPKVLNVKLWTK